MNENSNLSEEPIFAEITICNKKGLHARASAAFVKLAGEYNAVIDVTKDGQTVGGLSIMGLMMLAAAQGSRILIEARGPEARAALDALTGLIEAKFNEGE